jgi:putative SOS response-associated peptidase YedK
MDELAEEFGLRELPDWKGPIVRYNIAPTQMAPVIRASSDATGRELLELKWGLIPFWAKEPGIGNRMINARSEEVEKKPAYRAAFRHRRCLIPATGFFEWMKNDDGSKQPHLIRREDGHPFALAGLWEHWAGGGDGPIESFTILTTEPNDLLRRLHNRMPVILKPVDYARWLDTGLQDVPQLKSLLQPAAPRSWTAYPVGRRVNSPRHDDAACIEPAA